MGWLAGWCRQKENGTDRWAKMEKPLETGTAAAKFRIDFARVPVPGRTVRGVGMISWVFLGFLRALYLESVKGQPISMIRSKRGPT